MPDITYVPLDWQDSPSTATPITQAALDHMEQGIDAATDQANAALTAAGQAVSKALVDVKGDLLIGTADNTLGRKALGNTADVLTVDPTDPTGVVWRKPPRDLPALAPPGLLHQWNPALSAYNIKPDNMAKFWAACKRVAAGVGNLNVLALCDSTGIGYDGSVYDADTTIPRQFGKALATKLGVPSVYVDGFQFATIAVAAGLRDQWTTTGAATTGAAGSGCLLTWTGVGTASWTSLDAGTSVELMVSQLSSSPITWKIDGVTQTAISTNGTATLKLVTVNGLAPGTHVVEIDGSAGQTIIVVSPRVYSPAVKQIVVDNYSFGGARANSGVAGQNFNDLTTTGLGNIVNLAVATSGRTPDLVLCILSNNDVLAGTAAATILAGLTAIRGRAGWATVPFIFVHPPKVAGSSDAIMDAVETGFYTMADTLNVGFHSWDDWVGRLTGYTANGLAGADGIHPTAAEQLGVGRHLALCVSPF